MNHNFTKAGKSLLIFDLNGVLGYYTQQHTKF